MQSLFSISEVRLNRQNNSEFTCRGFIRMVFFDAQSCARTRLYVQSLIRNAVEALCDSRGECIWIRRLHHLSDFTADPNRYGFLHKPHIETFVSLRKIITAFQVGLFLDRNWVRSAVAADAVAVAEYNGTAARLRTNNTCAFIVTLCRWWVLNRLFAGCFCVCMCAGFVCIWKTSAGNE